MQRRFMLAGLSVGSIAAVLIFAPGLLGAAAPETEAARTRANPDKKSAEKPKAQMLPTQGKAKVVPARGGANSGSDTSGNTSGGGGGNLAPLSMVPVPMPVGGDVVDQAAAARLGKAFFWDVQTGGDGQTACATCHFHGGADTRKKNTIHPGPDGTFQVVSGTNQMFDLKSFMTDDRVGSQGVVGAIFVSVAADPTVAADNCTPDETMPFGPYRRVTGRQTPPAVGAIFNRDNFWDGRANHLFNGQDPFGATGNVLTVATPQQIIDKRHGGRGDAGGTRTDNGKGRVRVENASIASAAVASLIENSSLSSQADGPPGSSTEMACAGRGFNGPNSLGAKMMARPALQFQQVSSTDSLLGGMANAPQNGLKCGTHLCTYQELVTAAFGPTLAADAVNQFSRIWGQAVQAYESTLIPDQTPLDKYLAGNKTALTSNQVKGLGVFTGKGSCVKCHAGPELSDATVSFANTAGLINEDGGDQGFHNIGVRPTAEDVGRAGLGPTGVPFSNSGSPFDRGAFKTPQLRNLKLTAPYFHNGNKATLADVVEFYNRGGDFPNPEKSKRIKPLSLDAGDKSALVDFLTNALTDCRAEMHRAPFDHPSLALPNGQALPAAGAAGYGACP